MEIHYFPLMPPVRVLIVNPLIEASQISIFKMLSGSVFGTKQLIHLIMLVYVNEVEKAEGFIHELTNCNFGCLHKIEVTSDLPSITDADVFCFMSDFKNPNHLDDDLDTDENFDTFYLILKVALSLGKSSRENKPSDFGKEKKYPVIFGESVLVIDMIHSMGNLDIPSSCYFCSPHIGSLARGILGELLQVSNKDINRCYVWGINDSAFHIEFEKPYIKHDKIRDGEHCDWEMVSKKHLKSLKLDHAEFNSSWMKKEFIEKVKQLAIKNPYGQIYKGIQFARGIFRTWHTSRVRNNTSMGVISDGSLRTTKGLPYYLPVEISNDAWEWKVDQTYASMPHVIQEIARFNKLGKKNHERLVKYCTKFIAENINQGSIPLSKSDEESTYRSSH